MGIFSIAPDGLTEVICSLMENTSTSFQTIPTSVEMNEVRRLEIAYSPAELGGSVRKSKRSLVPVKFRIIVWGADQTTALANGRLLAQAVTNPGGGYIKYRPLGLAAGVLTTYYRYLQSPPPKLVRRGAVHGPVMEMYAQVGRAGTDYGILFEIGLMTEAWATSDPNTLVTIKSATTISNHDDSGHDNFVTVLNADIKGDGVIPVIQITLAAGSPIGYVILDKKTLKAGTSTNIDAIEGEDFSTAGTDSTPAAVGTASNDEYRALPDGNQTMYIPVPSAIKEIEIGKTCFLIVCRNSAVSSVNDVRVRLRVGTLQYLEATDYHSVSHTSTTTWYLVDNLKSLNVPPFKVQEFFSDTSSPTVGEHVNNSVRIDVDAVHQSGAGHLEIDYVTMLPTSAPHWVALFEYLDTDSLLNTSTQLDIDAITGGPYLIWKATSEMLTIWKVYGMPVASLFLEKGYDHRLRFLWTDIVHQLTISNTMSVTVKGIYTTIFPFEEA